MGGHQLQHTEAGSHARGLVQHQVPGPGVRPGVRGGHQGGARDVPGGREPAVRAGRLPAGLRHVAPLPVTGAAALLGSPAAVHVHHQVSPVRRVRVSHLHPAQLLRHSRGGPDGVQAGAGAVIQRSH